MKVVFLLGSESDKEFAEKITFELDQWEIPHVLHVASAHKVPEKVLELIKEYDAAKEEVVYVTIAGRSNGLSGVTAANSIRPVIACPPFASKEDMIINLNSTLMMPSDTPVLTVLDPKNVAAACARIFGLADKGMEGKVEEKIKDIKKSFA